MTTLNEAILQATGGPSVNEGLLAYYKDGGASADNLADSERQWLCAQLGVAVSDPATNADLWMQYLADYPGSLNDKQLAFWLDGGSSLEAAVRALFANGEEGALYYFTENFAGLYQDATGTTPVTAAGQPVGLMLDRRFGLERGSELTEDPDCITGEGWSTSSLVVHEPGKFLFPGGASSSLFLKNENIKLGRYYAVEIICEFSQAVGLRFSGSIATEVAVIESGTTNLVVPALGDGQIRILADQSTTGYVSRFSVREVPGNHASQTTTTARPTLRSGPLRIDYDGVDDYLRTVFPDLGSDVTIARSIPGVGAQILTGQTIAAGNWDDNVDSCATLVIDRALTGPETALVTAFLNQQAGV